MAKDPGKLQGHSDGADALSYHLELLDRAPSEHAKAVIVSENLVLWIQKKGIPPRIHLRRVLSAVTILSNCPFSSVMTKANAL